MINRTLILGYVLLVAAWLALAPLPATAQHWNLPGAPKRNQLPKQTGDKPEDLAFDDSDMLRGYIAQMKTTYFVGEPIVIPLALCNHTKHPITLETNLSNFRSMVTVNIRPEGQPSYRYNGPFMPGYVAPVPYKLFPLDELHAYLVVWADWDNPTHLAIDKPGRYTIDVSVQISVSEAKIPMQQLIPQGGAFTITVEPTPKELEPLLDLIKQDMNAVYIQLHKNPPTWGERTADILKQYPNSPFTPYLLYCLGSYYAAQYDNKPTREAADKSLIYYQNAVVNKWAFWEEAYIDLLNFMDKLDLGQGAAYHARRMLDNVSEDRLGHIGNLEVLQKYLVNTAELDPTRYWAFLP